MVSFLASFIKFLINMHVGVYFRHGAEVVDRTEAATSARMRAPAFVGTGYRLGDTEGAPPVVIRSGVAAGQGPQQVRCVLV